MSTLSTQTSNINVVISLNGLTDDEKVKARLKEFCDEKMSLYAFIIHDKDINEDGSLKTKHVHLVGKLKNNRRRLSSTLLDIATALECSTLAVSIDKMQDLVGSIQYLIHKNNSAKHQYDKGYIITNLSEGELDTYLNSDSKSMSIEYLIDVIMTHPSKMDIMRIIGLTYYHLYRNVINDIYREIYGTC